MGCKLLKNVAFDSQQLLFISLLFLAMFFLFHSSVLPFFRQIKIISWGHRFDTLFMRSVALIGRSPTHISVTSSFATRTHTNKSILMSIMLNDLNRDVLGTVITIWLSLIDVGNLDSSLCNQNGRSNFLDVVFQFSKAFTQPDDIDSTSECFVLWTLARNIELHSLILHHNILKSFVFKVPINFSKIKSIQMKAVHEDSKHYFKSILMECMNLEHIEVRNNFSNDLWETLMQYCPNLTSCDLECGSSTIKPLNTVHRFSKTCPLMTSVRLGLHYSRRILDDQVAKILENWKHLKYIECKQFLFGPLSLDAMQRNRVILSGVNTNMGGLNLRAPLANALQYQQSFHQSIKNQQKFTHLTLHNYNPEHTHKDGESINESFFLDIADCWKHIKYLSLPKVSESICSILITNCSSIISLTLQTLPLATLTMIATHLFCLRKVCFGCHAKNRHEIFSILVQKFQPLLRYDQNYW